jgi:hypothetical protein
MKGVNALTYAAHMSIMIHMVTISIYAIVAYYITLNTLIVIFCRTP